MVSLARTLAIFVVFMAVIKMSRMEGSGADEDDDEDGEDYEEEDVNSGAGPPEGGGSDDKPDVVENQNPVRRRTKKSNKLNILLVWIGIGVGSTVTLTIGTAVAFVAYKRRKLDAERRQKLPVVEYRTPLGYLLPTRAY